MKYIKLFEELGDKSDDFYKEIEDPLNHRRNGHQDIIRDEFLLNTKEFTKKEFMEIESCFSNNILIKSGYYATVHSPTYFDGRENIKLPPKKEGPTISVYHYDERNSW